MRYRNTIHPDHTSPGVRFDEELKGVLIYIFITMRKYDIGKIASKLNMEYNDLYAYISGRRTMPVTLLLRITEATADKIFFDTVFAGSNIMWNFKRNPSKNSGDPVKEFLEVGESIGEIAKALNKALSDNCIQGFEKTELRSRIGTAINELQSLMDSIDKPKSVYDHITLER